MDALVAHLMGTEKSKDESLPAAQASANGESQTGDKREVTLPVRTAARAKWTDSMQQEAASAEAESGVTPQSADVTGAPGAGPAPPMKQKGPRVFSCAAY